MKLMSDALMNLYRTPTKQSARKYLHIRCKQKTQWCPVVGKSKTLALGVMAEICGWLGLRCDVVS